MILTFLRLVLARARGRAIDLEFPGGRRFWLYPDGEMLPVIAGASDVIDDDAPEPEIDPEPADDPEIDDDPDDAPEPPPAPKPDGEYDEERAMRTIKRQRAEAKKLKAERDAEKARADELARANETEHERLVRETGEAKEREAAARRRADTAAINLALRDAAAEEGIPGKKLKRALKMVDRDEISVDEDGNVEGAEEAITDLLEEFPEFRDAPATSTAEPDDDEPPRRKPGANPDRKTSREGGELSAKQVARIAREDPDRFIQLMDEGKIGSEQMGGKELSRLRSEGKLSTRSADAEHGVTPTPHTRG
jgi:hypothetical protein